MFHLSRGFCILLTAMCKKLYIFEGELGAGRYAILFSLVNYLFIYFWVMDAAVRFYFLNEVPLFIQLLCQAKQIFIKKPDTCLTCKFNIASVDCALLQNNRSIQI